MKLSDEQQKQVVEFMERTWPKDAGCPICHRNDWAIRNRTFEVIEHAEGSARNLRRLSMPLVAVTCENCGNVVFMNAALLGLASPVAKANADRDKPAD